MWRRASWGLVSISAAAAVWLVSSLGLPAPNTPPAPPAKSNPPPASKQPASAASAPAPTVTQAYLGVGGCVGCHRPQADVWSTTKHSHEFSGLPPRYRGDPSCLKCHVTGYGSPTGYVAAAPVGSAKDLGEVGCEMCHGPGALHVDAAQRFANSTRADEERLEKEMRASIRKVAPESVCAACHITQAHQAHPAYEGQPNPPGVASRASATYVPASACPVPCSNMGWDTATGDYPPVGTTIKACAACHYQKYKNWIAGKHAGLAASLPVKYAKDGNCVNCHTAGSGMPASLAASNDPHMKADRLGVACEFCHGPGRDHVHYNMQFISSPPLGPEMEQVARQLIRKGKPENSCLDCHLLHAHKEHPKYDKP